MGYITLPGHIRSGWSGDSVIWIPDGTEGIGKGQVSFSDSWSGSTICETKGLTSKILYTNQSYTSQVL